MIFFLNFLTINSVGNRSKPEDLPFVILRFGEENLKYSVVFVEITDLIAANSSQQCPPQISSAGRAARGCSQDLLPL